MRVGVTGGNGFIGGYVVDELIFRNHTPVVFDRHSHPPDLDVVLGDVRDPGALIDLAEHVDGIVHLAAVLGTQETIGSATRYAAEVNVFGGLNMLEAVRLTGIPAVNICVGNYWMRNTYSTSKRMVERLAEQYRDEDGCKINQVRCVNAYGPRQLVAAPFGPGKVRKMVPSFICRALSGLPVEVYGDGSQISDCVHVEDVAGVLVSALEAAAAGVIVPTVEVGPVDHVSVRDIAHLIVDMAGTSAPITYLQMRPGEQIGRPVIADTSTLKTLDIDPNLFTPLDEGLAETVEWFAKYEGTHWTRPR